MRLPAALPVAARTPERVRSRQNSDPGLIEPQGCSALEWIGCAAAVAACGALSGPAFVACVAAAAPGCAKCVT